MKYNTLIVIATLTLSGCASSNGFQNHVAGSTPASSTQTVRDVNGATQYRIRDSSVFNTNGARVARIDSSGNIFNTNGARVGRVSNK
jgi:outer membrane lipoprotein SlyB